MLPIAAACRCCHQALGLRWCRRLLRGCLLCGRSLCNCLLRWSGPSLPAPFFAGAFFAGAFLAAAFFAGAALAFFVLVFAALAIGETPFRIECGRSLRNRFCFGQRGIAIVDEFARKIVDSLPNVDKDRSPLCQFSTSLRLKGQHRRSKDAGKWRVVFSQGRLIFLRTALGRLKIVC